MNSEASEQRQYGLGELKYMHRSMRGERTRQYGKHTRKAKISTTIRTVNLSTLEQTHGCGREKVTCQLS